VPSAEPVGAGGEGGVEDLLAAGLDMPGGAVVDRGWRVEADPGMAVLGVVVGEEDAAECAGVFEGGEGAGEYWAVLKGLERQIRSRGCRSIRAAGNGCG
jgi:hypothetical protein